MTATPILMLLQADPRSSWLPVVLLIVIGAGPGKEMTYESGMVPIGDTRRRFNVRFYLVAMIFLVFDVEIVFFYPWATVFPDAVVRQAPNALALLIEMVVFVVILLVAYFYAWGKGVFKWD
jgi:NADH-quinone oxidoreductase subunit A